MKIPNTKKHAAATVFAALFLTFGVLSCDDKDTKSTTSPDNTVSIEYGNVSREQAKSLVDANTGKNTFVVLDVRTPSEFASGHIAGAVNADFNADSFADDVAALDTAKTYLVYCRSGSRSASAVAYMKQQGFAKIYNMTGGVIQWSEAGYELVQ